MIEDDYLGNAEHSVKPPSEESSPTFNRSDITSDLNKSYLKSARDTSPVVRDDYLSNDVYADNLDQPVSSHRVVSHVRIRSEEGNNPWSYNNMKKVVYGYMPRSYLSAFRVLAEIPNSYYVSVSLEKIAEWIAAMNRQS